MTTQYQKQFDITPSDLDAADISPWTPLEPGLNKVWVGYAAGASGTVDVLVSYDKNPADATKRFNAELNGTPVQFTANKMFDLTGPGYIAFKSTDLVGTLEVLLQSTRYAGA